ncbi:Myb/SANT-like DNA-binding domain [Popillia japonica]|uniref:Regulatory protein zeste n=1 Tax=Popillia japonica TaxID=7064 RepID=A0AAW1MBL9_POPJA
MSDKIRKIRGTNFTKEEELLLLEEVDKEKLIVECKITNKTSSIEKEQAWTRIACRFNSRNLECRSIDQLKSKYDNLKSKARKVVANKRASLKGTGGSPTCGGRFDPIIGSILKIINIKTIVGHTSKFDSDSSCADYDWKKHDIPLLHAHSSASPIPVRMIIEVKETNKEINDPIPSCINDPIPSCSFTNQLVIEEQIRKEETEKKEEQRRQEEHNNDIIRFANSRTISK